MVYIRIFMVILFQVVLSIGLGILLARRFVRAETFSGMLLFQTVIIAVLMLVFGVVLHIIFLL